MNEWTTADLRQQLARIRRNGIYAMLQTSAVKHGLPPAYVLAVASRETNCTNILGDGGHGHGPMQLDDRSHPIPAGWREDPSQIIDTCCGILSTNLIWASRKWPAFTAEQHRKIAAAAYNSGPGNAARGVAEGDADAHDTGHDYGADVLRRMAAFVALLGGT